MDVQELRKLLEESNDKLSIFGNRNLLSQYKFNVNELVCLINDFLTDEQKAQLFDFEHFRKLRPYVKTSIIIHIADDKRKLKLLENVDFISEFSNTEVEKIIKSLGDDGKIEVLQKPDFLQIHNIKSYSINAIIKSLSEENKRKLLSNKDFIEGELHLDNYLITDIVSSIESEEIKQEMMSLYKLERHQMVNILKTFSDESKKTIVLEEQYDLSIGEMQALLSALSVDSLLYFIKDHKDFLTQKDIKLYNITRNLADENQVDFVSRFEDIGLSIEEKRQILATLSQKAKKNIDTLSFPPEYRTAIEQKINKSSGDIYSWGKIVVDYSKDLEDYRDLDELLYINPTNISSEERAKLFRLCEICPRISMIDNLHLFVSSNVEEYQNAEKWIESILQGVKAEWTDIQKIAHIDNAIGKKISYSPDFDTEIFAPSEARALWHIIDSGYGVCNGIAQVEKYILDRLEIETEMVSGNKHTFLKVKNLEIKTADGKIIKGDTILDPTWNLAAQRYGAKPENFCRSYAEIRKHDISANGEDAECHRNDAALASATLDVDEKTLRAIYTSIGLADKEGNFPIKSLIDKSKIIDDYKLPEEEAIKKQLLLLANYYPEFATCQNSTSTVLQGVVLAQENMNFNRCVVSRVYEREDENKRPILYVYVDLPEAGKKFYFAESETQQFVELPQKEFESRFECYEMDMEKQGGNRPWEDLGIQENIEDLNRSSGKVIASEGDER